MARKSLTAELQRMVGVGYGEGIKRKVGKPSAFVLIEAPAGGKSCREAVLAWLRAGMAPMLDGPDATGYGLGAISRVVQTLEHEGLIEKLPARRGPKRIVVLRLTSGRGGTGKH